MNFIKKHIDFILLACLCVGIIISNIVWLKIDTQPVHWDEARHLWTSSQYYGLVKDWLNNLPHLHYLKQIIKSYFYYPPFFYLLTVPLYFLSDQTADNAILINSLYVIVLTYSTYGAGKYLWNRQTGLMAALFISVSPMILSFFREYQLDMPLTASVALSFYLLLKTERFDNRFYSILFALSCGIGMLTKWTFPLFILGPIVYTTFQLATNLVSKKKETLKAAVNLLTACVIFSIITIPWYLLNKTQLLFDFKANGLISTPEKGSFLIHLVNDQTYLILLIFVIIGTVFSMVNKKIFKTNLILLLSIGLIIVLMQLLINNTDARYMLPWMVYASILGAFWITQLRNNFRVILSVVFVLTCLFSFYSVSFGFKFLPKNYSISVMGQNVLVYGQHGYTTGNPIKDDWKIQTILSDVTKDGARQKKDSPLILSTYLDDSRYINNWNLAYYSAVNTARDIKFEEMEKLYLVDYVITRFGNLEGYKNFQSIEPKFEAEKNSKDVSFELTKIGTYSLPLGDPAVLYRVNLTNSHFSIRFDDRNFFTEEEIMQTDDGKVINVKQGSSRTVLWGPYHPFVKGSYHVKMSIKLLQQSDLNDVVDLQVYSNQQGAYYGTKEIKASQLVPGVWQDIELNFENKNDKDKLEFRVVAGGKSDFFIKSLDVEKVN